MSLNLAVIVLDYRWNTDRVIDIPYEYSVHKILSYQKAVVNKYQ